MAKGYFSQGMMLLTDGTTTIDDVKAALEAKEYEVVKRLKPKEHWQFGGPMLLVAYEPEDNGYAAIDIVDHTWPDSMGDPKTDSMTFGAWSTGQFGPYAFPGGLERA